MFRKIFFLFFTLICFMSTIITEKAISATPITKEAPQLRYYSRKDDSFHYFLYVTRYSNQKFNLEIEGANENRSKRCKYKSTCSQSGELFICKGEKIKDPSTGKTIQDELIGTIKDKEIEVLKANDMQHCKEGGSLMGKFDQFNNDTIVGRTTRTTRATPIINLSGAPEGYAQSNQYLLKDQNAKDFVVINVNNTEIFDKFYNEMIDIEYFIVDRGCNGEKDYSNVIYKINGKNPMEIK